MDALRAWRPRKRVSQCAALLVTLGGLAAGGATDARAERDGGEPPSTPAAEPPSTPAAEPTDKPDKAAPTDKSGSGGEGEGDEGDHAPPAPSTRAPPMPRHPAVLKDGMLRIPAGRFTMGTSDVAAPPNERPARTVAVNAYWIDRTEVTVVAYQTCVERGACVRPPRSSPLCTFDLGDPQLPVACVPWTSANAYCLAAGKRLPREVEWENAARGTSPIKYPWGGGPGCGVAAILAGETTNRTCSGKRPSHVGAHLGGGSPYGVQDMSGNVEEWVADWYAESIVELSPRAGASHVLRGGGWLSAPSLARTTTRNWGSVREAGPNVGFRCAKDD